MRKNVQNETINNICCTLRHSRQDKVFEKYDVWPKRSSVTSRFISLITADVSARMRDTNVNDKYSSNPSVMKQVCSSQFSPSFHLYAQYKSHSNHNYDTLLIASTQIEICTVYESKIQWIILSKLFPIV